MRPPLADGGGHAVSGAVLVEPHGGRLVRRIVQDRERADELVRARHLPRVELDDPAAADLELIAVGAYSPLDGFMTRDEYEAVLTELHLPGGLPWTLPVLLRVDEAVARGLVPGGEVALWHRGVLVGTLEVCDRFRVDREREARLVYGTADPAHPGVAMLSRAPGAALGGPVRLLQRPRLALRRLVLDPADVRSEIGRRGWLTVAAFQSRNPPHRAHEYLMRVALELCDGLLLHPLVGATKEDDVPAAARAEAYRALVDGYLPAERVLLAGFPGAMRYAGPREAVFHAIVRKNYGATHFIVGRDHAGVGRFYGPFDAQRIFARFDPQRLGITPLCFDDAFYCLRCEGMATSRTCRHGEAERVAVSGTRLRAWLRAGSLPPPEWMRPEVARVLSEALRAC